LSGIAKAKAVFRMVHGFSISRIRPEWCDIGCTFVRDADDLTAACESR